MNRSDVEVALVEGEYVADRGTQRISWWIRRNDAWIHCSAWPGAEVERITARSGTVWETCTRLSAAPGTSLLRVERRPIEPPRRDVIDYLARAGAKQYRTLRREFRIGARGALLAQKK